MVIDSKSVHHTEVLVKPLLKVVFDFQVEAVGICAGDAKTFTGAERFWGESFQQI